MAEHVAFVDEVAGDGSDAEFADAVEVGLDGLLAFAGVLLQQAGRDRCGVDEGVVEEALVAAVRLDAADVLGGREAEVLFVAEHSGDQPRLER